MGTVVQGVWALVLSRYSGDRDVVFGATVAGRSPELPGVESMLGLFINTLPVRARVPHDASMASFLQDLQRHQVAARVYEQTALVDVQRWSEVPRGTPLFQTLLVIENFPVDLFSPDTRSSSDLRITAVRHAQRTNYPLTVVASLGRQTVLRFDYETAHLDAPAVERMATQVATLLTSVASNPDCPVRDLSWLSIEERRALIASTRRRRNIPTSRSCRRSSNSGPPGNARPHRGDLWARRVPTYGALNRRANVFAHALREAGVGPEVRVGICVEPSLDLAIGLLAILKAGGAYVPLDPVYPPERLRVVAEDAGVALLVTHQRVRDRLPALTCPVWCLDDARARPIAACGEDPAPLARPEHVAYVIYTSGSTGRPKGVMVTHANLSRLFRATEAWFHFDARDVWTLFHSSAFDFSVWEIWGALIHGGRLVVVPSTVSRTPEAFYDLLVREGVTVLNQTPSAFRLLDQAEAAKGADPHLSLRLVVFGGETLEFASLTGWFARHPTGPQLVNGYGITETTVFVTYTKWFARRTSPKRQA